MLRPLLRSGARTQISAAAGSGLRYNRNRLQARSIFSFLRRSKTKDVPTDPVPTLAEDNLFHPFSSSPFPAIRARGEAVKKLAPCPVCSEGGHHHPEEPASALPKAASFECPDCGWPSHCSEQHWKDDPEHKKYCSRLREANEDEHDLRSGRRLREFELPGEQGFEEAISFANWDVFWYTRNFPSMDTERSRRHASKLLTYPITIGAALHQHSNLTLSNQRVTPEGSRSLAALRSVLHPPTGAPETVEATAGKPQVRIFILGARAESSLPPHVWEQLTMLFPSTQFHLFFIGPQVSLPKPPTSATAASLHTTSDPSPAPSSTAPPQEGQPVEDEDASKDLSEKKSYVPNVYQPPTPPAIPRLKRTRSSLERYGIPSYTVPYTPQLTITGMQANYADVHAQFQHTLDPYSDVFFLFSPGFGFPSMDSTSAETGEPLLQVASPTEWGPVLPMLLASKCTMFVTGFSPTDVERDVRSLSTAPEVAGEFEWVVTPGPNSFGSEKWEIADFDPRVMVKTNWGIWAIRGKSRDIQEKGRFEWLGL